MDVDQPEPSLHADTPPLSSSSSINSKHSSTPVLLSAPSPRPKPPLALSPQGLSSLADVHALLSDSARSQASKFRVKGVMRAGSLSLEPYELHVTIDDGSGVCVELDVPESQFSRMGTGVSLLAVQSEQNSEYQPMTHKFQDALSHCEGVVTMEVSPRSDFPRVVAMEPVSLAIGYGLASQLEDFFR
jgi:hypothetical protein